MIRKRYFLGIDGGQSHTTALVAEASGKIVGKGRAGPSNHTLAPGGRERLEQAIAGSVAEALRQAGLLDAAGDARRFEFHSAHLAMTGEPRDKVRIARALVRSRRLAVAHDAPAALAGATAGKDGIIVLSGTGSVVLGKRGSRTVRIGGRGYLFADQGSAFAMAREAVSRAHFLAERRKPSDALQGALLLHFRRRSLVDIIEDYYRHIITRDQLASFSRRLPALAGNGDPVSLEILARAAEDLAEMAGAAAARLRVLGRPTVVSYSGGVFRSRLLRELFAGRIAECFPKAQIRAPRFGPEVGALLLAFEEAGRLLDRSLLSAVERSLHFRGRIAGEPVRK